MYNYSPLKTLYIKNFRNLGEVEIDFTQSPIVTLLGENEAGKTSVIKAFTTCALNAKPRDQKDFIRDGTQMFGVALDLEDGTRILRIKEASGINSYQVLKDGKAVWSTNKITDGLPAEVQSRVGLIEEPETGEFLHIRTYEDKLMFVETASSANYKVMYNALKVEQLTKAIKAGQVEVNSIKSAIGNNDNSLNTLGSQLKEISIIDTEPLTSIRDRLKEQMATIDKIEKAKELSIKLNELERQLGALGLLERFNLQPVNEVLASKLSSTSRLLNNRIDAVNLSSVYKQSESIEFIDTSVLDKLAALLNKQNGLSEKIANAGELANVANLSEIPEMTALHISKLGTLIDSSKTLTESIHRIDTSGCVEIEQSAITRLDKLAKMHASIETMATKKQEADTLLGYVEQIQTYLKQCGVAVEACPKCGEAVVFDVDKIGV